MKEGDAIVNRKATPKAGDSVSAKKFHYPCVWYDSTVLAPIQRSTGATCMALSTNVIPNACTIPNQ